MPLLTRRLTATRLRAFLDAGGVIGAVARWRHFTDHEPELAAFDYHYRGARSRRGRFEGTGHYGTDEGGHDAHTARDYAKMALRFESLTTGKQHFCRGSLGFRLRVRRVKKVASAESASRASSRVSRKMLLLAHRALILS